MIPRPPRSTLFPTRRSSDLLADLDQQHPFPGPGQEIDFVRLRKESSPFGRCRDQHFATGEPRDANDLRTFRRPREPSSGARARFDEAVEIESQREAVRADRDGMYGGGYRNGAVPLFRVHFFRKRGTAPYIADR